MAPTLPHRQPQPNAPAVFDGPIDGASFLAYIEQV